MEIKTKKLIGDEFLIHYDDLKNGCETYYKGHDIPEDVLKEEILSDYEGLADWSEEDIEENKKEQIVILKTEHKYYYCTRFIDGSDAKEHGHSHWVQIVDEKDKKSTYGKCTEVTFKIVLEEQVK
jgi:hypothetical protein